MRSGARLRARPSRAWWLAGVTGVVLAGGAAQAQPTRHAVAVLEHRSGAALDGVATRLATELGRLTGFAVSSPDQARATFGETLDAQVVRCSGDGACLADLGYRLGVQEVVLVAVSEFGDAVITLQRIGVDSRKVEARVAEALDRGKALDDDTLDRYLTRLLPPSVFLQFGVIDVVANQRGATVRIDGDPRGQTPITPLRVRAPASYDLRVDKPGFVSFSATVAVPPQGAVKVTAQLTRRAPKGAWYQRRWVIAVAAATVVSAAGTAAYFASRRDRELSLGGSVK
jgi:hypothetical protein